MVEAMRRKYEQWFKDVSSTREDNYAPPRIHIGTEHENPVVLTRQDWRHVKGRTWATDSNGHWELFAATSGEYDVRLRFPKLEVGARATLDISGRKLTAEVDEGATDCTFESVAVSRGKVRLLATLATGDRTKGPWQVDVFLK